MKKTMMFSVVLMSVSSAWYCVAGTARPMSEAVTIQGELVKVIYSNPEPCDVTITIANENGDVLLTDKIKGKSEFIRPYNFSELEEGTYEVTIQDDAGERVNEIEYHAPEQEEMMAHISFIGNEANDENLYLVAVPCQGEEEVTITVYDANHHVLHTDTKHINSDYASVYRVIGAKDGVVFKVTNKEGKEKSFEY